MSDATFDSILAKLTEYKKKYFINALLKGSIISVGLILTLFILVNFIEYFGNLNKGLRFILFTVFIGGALISSFKWLAIPIYKLLHLEKELSDEEAARQIGQYFPEISDKLLNTIQLKSLQKNQSDLLAASIKQKTQSLSYIPFVDAIDYKENSRYGRLLIIPLAFIGIILAFAPRLFLESTHRILHFDKHFAAPAPFDFYLQNKSLKTFRNEDFKVLLNMQGKVIPESVYIIVNDKRSKMLKESNGLFTYTFRNVQSSEVFGFEAAGYNSNPYTLSVLYKPEVEDFNALLKYPSYLNKKDEVIKNLGNMVVPQGTKITWNFRTNHTNHLQLSFGSSHLQIDSKDNLFTYSKVLMKSEEYNLKLSNNESKSGEDINYLIEVIPDQFPSIAVEDYKDTATYRFISLGGSLSDDHGLTRMRLSYRIKEEGSKSSSLYKSVGIPINPKLPSQNYLYNWTIDSLKVGPGRSLEYFLEVWDNDQVNGSKSSKTRVIEFKLPSIDKINEEISKASKKNEQSINSLINKTAQLRKDIENLDDKLKNKNNINWQDKKLLDDVLKQQNELKQEIEQLNKDTKELQQKNEQFNNLNPELTQKVEQLQQLMNELMDEETKKLYEELQKMLNENINKPEMEKILEQLKNKDENLENELERTLEMFKELKFDQKLDETVEKLKDLSEKQENLSKETNEKEKKENTDQLQEKQEKLNSDFKKVEEDLKELDKMNESLENKKDLENFEKDEQGIENEQKNSSEQLKNNDQKKASKSQKSAADKMKQMQEKLADMKQGMEMDQMQENLDDLRAILENLITLSFEQEALMKDFRKLNQSDPRFITLSQKQLKLKDDSKIIEDSLLSLAKRVFQIQSFVTREVSKMKGYMDESTEYLKDRRPDIATGKQQFAMTSINNLALLLNDALKQMQEQMANAMKSGGKMCNKPGNKKQGSSPGLGELQKQLNEKIQDLQKSGKAGRSLSEELAKLAAQQEMIRNALKELDKKGGKEGGKNQPGSSGNDGLSKEMQETEKDLVNKQLNHITINRQKEILTRLLEAEKAAKERELDNKREAKSAEEKQNFAPPSMEKYLRTKENEIDLLKTISPQFSPYFKQQVNDYFQKIEK